MIRDRRRSREAYARFKAMATPEQWAEMIRKAGVRARRHRARKKLRAWQKAQTAGPLLLGYEKPGPTAAKLLARQKIREKRKSRDSLTGRFGPVRLPELTRGD